MQVPWSKDVFVRPGSGQKNGVQKRNAIVSYTSMCKKPANQAYVATSKEASLLVTGTAIFLPSCEKVRILKEGPVSCRLVMSSHLRSSEEKCGWFTDSRNVNLRESFSPTGRRTGLDLHVDSKPFTSAPSAPKDRLGLPSTPLMMHARKRAFPQDRHRLSPFGCPPTP